MTFIFGAGAIWRQIGAKGVFTKFAGNLRLGVIWGPDNEYNIHFCVLKQRIKLLLSFYRLPHNLYALSSRQIASARKMDVIFVIRTSNNP